MPSNPVVLTVTGLSSSAGTPTWFPDTIGGFSPFNIGIGTVVNSTGTQTYNIEHTFDYFGNLSSGFNGFLSSLATWYANTGISAATSNANGNYAFPVTAIRLNVTAGASQGTVTAKLVQAG
jgi:hypothetical protein